jgi:hypothetical protein
MGFLSNLARQIKGKSDDEAMEVIQRRANMSLVPPPPADPITLPPPARRVIPMAGTPPPPMPAPTRAAPAVDIGTPPPADPYSLNAMEDLAGKTRRMMAAADYSEASMGADGNLTGVKFPTPAPPVPPPTRTTAPVEGIPALPASDAYVPPPMKPTTVGESYEGMSPAQRMATKLRVLRDAAPESKVRDTGSGYEVLPPQRTGRLKAAGRGFLQLLSAGAPFGIAGMGGSGMVGAIQGAINPRSVDERGRAMDIYGTENELARTQGLETQQIQNEARRVQNVSAIAGLQNQALDRQLNEDKELRTEWQQGLNNIGELQKRQEQLDPAGPQYAAAEQAIQKEAERLSKRTGRTITVIPGNPRVNKLPHITIDGEVIQQQRDGGWKKIYGTPKSDTEDTNADQKAEYEWQTKNAENEAKRTAAAQEAAALEATATNHQQKVTTAAAEVSRIMQAMQGIPATIPGVGPNPQYEALKNQREQAERTQNDEQRKMDAAYEKLNEKKAEAAKYPTMPPPPKRARRGSAATGNVVQKLSKSAWEASHPGGDWNAAQAEANRRKIPIIP